MPPTVTLDAFAETVARAIAKYPEEKGRIERGAQLAATGHADQISADLWAVRSQTDESVYIVDATGCPCVDQARHSELACKHQWAITLLTVAQERARRLASRQPATAAPVAEDGRALLARLIEQRAAQARMVYASGNRPVEDPRCLALDEQIARLRSRLPAVTLRSAVAA